MKAMRAPGATGAAVADQETHDARVEVDHAVEVGGVHAKMRELGRKGHELIVPPDPRRLPMKKGIMVRADLPGDQYCLALPAVLWLS